MNINGYGANAYYGSTAYQSQMARYKEAAEAKERRKNTPEPRSEDYISYGALPKGEIIRPIETVINKPDNSGGSFWEALQKQKEFYMNIQVADFKFEKSGRPEDMFASSGDALNDASIRAGLIYRKSCLNFKNHGDYYGMTKSEDFTDMSREEIYKAIYLKYQHCYGERFMDMNAVDFILPPDRDDDVYMEILRNFNKEIKEACGLSDYRERFALRRNALYPDMSDEEVEQAIIDEYKERLGSDITNTDICKMCQEMQECGVGHGVRNFFNHQENFNIYGYGTSITSVDAQTAWLGRKASASTFDQAYSAFKSRPTGASLVDPAAGGMILRIKAAVCPKIKYYI